MLEIIFLLCVALTILLISRTIYDIARFIGHSIVMAGGHLSKVAGFSPINFTLLPFPATYVVWYLLTF